MLALRHLLVAIDFSTASRGALRVAGALAQTLGGRLHLIHVAPPTPTPQNAALPLPALAAADGPHLLVEDRTALEQDLRAFHCEELPDRSEPEIIVSFGQQPDEAIVEAARRIDADLILTGTHGRKGLARLLLGSVAEQVLRRAPCPVLTVHQPPDEAWSPRSVLVATDFCEPSRRAEDLAADIARASSGELAVLNVVDPDAPARGQAIGHASAAEGGALSTRLAQARQAAGKVVTRLSGRGAGGDRLRATIHARGGKPAEQIVAAADEIGADLIVLATHARTGIARLVLGSTAEGVVRASERPVLVVQAIARSEGEAS